MLACVAEPTHLPAAGGTAWGTSCLDKVVDLVWCLGGGTRDKLKPNVGPAYDVEQLQEGGTPQSAPLMSRAFLVLMKRTSAVLVALVKWNPVTI